MRKALILMGLTVVGSSAFFVACGSSSGDDTTATPEATGGSTSSVGGTSSSVAGHAGTSGASAGTAGTSAGGAAGAAGSTAGNAGHAGAGAGGAAGTAGAATAGSGGAAGASAGAAGTGGSTGDPTCGGFFKDQTNACDVCGASVCCTTSTACEADTTCSGCLAGMPLAGCDLTAASPNAALKALADCLTTNGVQADSTGTISGTCSAMCQGPVDCAAPETSTTGGSCIPADMTTFPCNPVTGGGCTGTDACDVAMNGSGQLTVACQPGANTATTCGACSYGGLAPFCATGNHCVPEGSSSAACARFCCDDTDCGSNAHCDKAFLQLPSTIDVFGLCMTDNGSGGTGGAAGAGGTSASSGAAGAGGDAAGAGGTSAASGSGGASTAGAAGAGGAN